MSHDEALKTQTRTAIDLVAKYHKSLAGTIIGDEYITDLNPSRGAELCTSTELMFSLAWIYQYLGDNDLADWAELTAFNAFPGQIWPDWWSHQYVQQENQVSYSMDRKCQSLTFCSHGREISQSSLRCGRT
jgi:hypothetical protein